MVLVVPAAAATVAIEVEVGVVGAVGGVGEVEVVGVVGGTAQVRRWWKSVAVKKCFHR